MCVLGGARNGRWGRLGGRRLGGRPPIILAGGPTYLWPPDNPQTTKLTWLYPCILMNLSTKLKYPEETFSVKLGHLLLFLSLELPFIKLQNNSPVYHLTICLLSIEGDKGAKTSLRYERYT